MRIGQLARHLNVSPSELIHFLEQQSFTFESGTNARLGEGHIRVILSKFAPEQLGNLENYVAEEDEPVQSPANHQESDSGDFAPPQTSLPETIRAPKIELQGLKVLGKIDLPEPKKKQIEQQTEVQEPSQDRPAYQKREHRPSKPWVNPLERQRQREAREAEERKRREAEARKEQRTAAYLSRQQKGKSRPSQKSKSVKEEEPQMSRPKTAKPTSFFGRIWYWLTNAE